MPKSLSIDQLKAGRLKALQNATELLNESSLLFANGYWARSVFLSIVVGEELGKHVMLISALVEVIMNPATYSWKKFWRRYSSHAVKNKNILILEDFALTEVGDLPAYFKELPNVAFEIEKGRQTALYSDCIEDVFHSPTDLFTERMATNALAWAKGRVDLIREFENRSLFRIETMTTAELSVHVSALRDKFKKFNA